MNKAQTAGNGASKGHIFKGIAPCEGIAKGIAAGCLLEERKNEMQRYSDVKPDAWFYDAVEKVSDAGLMQGSDGKFRPNETVTRAEMATILSRLLER